MSPNKKPTVHLICNAHLDPVWQWRWEEGVSEALATFRNAVDILGEHPGLIFCHNEAVLYQWVERLDPALFEDIRRLVRAGRWAVTGGWFIQPDTNLPGTESLIRHIAEGRLYFRDRFGAAPLAAYNFDSFGHSAGLPQLLRRAGYGMYIHMRPQAHELELPGDLYRWRGADGTVIPAYRISVGLYHTERDNIEERLRAGVALALKLGRDVPLFWGLGNHGGGATRRDLETIDGFINRESRVRIVHSTPDAFFETVREAAEKAPVFDGDLQRCFTGCYTSLSRLKRRAVRSLGGLVQSGALAAASWWLRGAAYPAGDLAEAWRLHLFNDFHDVLTGSCIEPAEADALDQYGRAEDIARGLRLSAAASLNWGGAAPPPLPVTVLSANPSVGRVPVEFECMADYRPFWKGEWHLRLFRPDGEEVPCQEEQPEALLPFNRWRRRISFLDTLPGVGVSRYEVRAFEGPAPSHGTVAKKAAALAHRIKRSSGLVESLKAPEGPEFLAGPLLEPLVVGDTGDSWGTECRSWRKVVGRFKTLTPPRMIESGPVRTIVQSVLSYGRSRIVMDVHSYPDWPVLEFRLRVSWNEERRRLKLRVPTALEDASVLCEVPAGAVARPADGEEHVHGRWLLVRGRFKGRAAALGLVNNGQPGFDFRDGEVRLSVLRSAAYCHERGFDLAGAGRKFSDIGFHEVRLLVAAGDPETVLSMLPGLADHLAAPPAAYAHLPILTNEPSTTLLSLSPGNLRLLACKRSWDGEALVVRLQEAVGKKTRGKMVIAVPPAVQGTGAPAVGTAEERGYGPEEKKRGQVPAGETKRGHVPLVHVSLTFAPFELKTLRIERDGRHGQVAMVEEKFE